MPKIRLIEAVRFYGLALAAITLMLAGLGFPEAALSPHSAARLNEFLLITITLEFSLFPFLRNYYSYMLVLGFLTG